MEIHPPERPLHSLKDILLQLATITIGILIALSLEGILTWFHHRSTVREARENIAREMRDNAAEIDDLLLKEIPKMRKDQEMLGELIQALQARRTPPVKEIRAGWFVAPLSSASWRTAELTGALAYMKYPEVQKYARIYDLQAKVSAVQDRFMEVVIPSMPSPHTNTSSPSELETWKQRVSMVSAYLQAEEGLSQSLRKEYEKALAGR